MRSDQATKPCPLCQAAGWVNIQCPICKGFGEVADVLPRVKKKRQNDETRRYAWRSGKRFTERDWRVLENPNITNRRAAQFLHRSLKSIEAARYRLRKEKCGYAEGTKEPDTDLYGS